MNETSVKPDLAPDRASERARTFRTAVIASSAGLAGAAIGAGWAAALEFSARFSTDVQVVAVQMIGLTIVTAEVGVIVLVSQYIRCHRATAMPDEHTSTAQTTGERSSQAATARAPQGPASADGG